MRMGQLSERSGVPIATIKYYLREGLLHAGRRTSRTQTEYDETHVRRLTLVRALLDIGGLSVAHAGEVIAAMDDESAPVNQVLSTAQQSVSGFTAGSTPVDRQAAETALDELVARQGWQVSPGNPGRAAAIDVLATFDHLDGVDYADLVQSAAAAADIVAEADLALVQQAGGRREQMVETVVTGTVLGDVLIVALRRMAQEHHARKQYPQG